MTRFEPQSSGIVSNRSTNWAITTALNYIFLKQWAHPASFSFISSFKTNFTNFTTDRYVKKCTSSIWCWDSNSWPLEHVSPPITTRPGLPPSLALNLVQCFKSCQKTWSYKDEWSCWFSVSKIIVNNIGPWFGWFPLNLQCVCYSHIANRGTWVAVTSWIFEYIAPEDSERKEGLL